MRLAIATESRASRDAGGAIWLDDNLVHLLDRWLGEVDEVAVFTRVDDVDHRPNGSSAVPERASISAAPTYSSLRGYLTRRRQVAAAADQCLGDVDVALMRAPGPLSAALARACRKQRVPYGVEVVGDPWDAFAPGAAESRLRPLVRLAGRLQMRTVVRGACTALYVTRSTLQARYPAAAGTPVFGASDVVLDGHPEQTAPRALPVEPPMRLVTVASMWQKYKRVDLIIDLVERLSRCMPVHLTVLGDGPLRAEYESQAAARHVPVTFVGQVDHQSIWSHFTDAHVFVTTSFVEGLPRAPIEAMHTGLPCFGFDVGGTRELAPGVYLSKRGDLGSMTAAILATLNDADTYTQRSRTALLTAHEYRSESRRSSFTEFANTLLAAGRR